MNRVEVQAMGIDAPIWTDRLGSFAEKALDQMGHQNWDLSLVLCDDSTIQELNSRYRGKDESTDVLSFQLGEPMEDEEAGSRFLAGDIVISLDTLGLNAQYFKVSPDEELRRLVIHGILHLDGQDHRTNDPDEPMLIVQEAILKRLSEERILP
jgi:probable rRNA maturation factor